MVDKTSIWSSAVKAFGTQSLGIDPISLKTCKWNCIYCQIGRTRPITNDRRVFFKKEVILSQVKEVLDKHTPDETSW